MSKRAWVWCIFAVFMAGLYVIFFSHWFDKREPVVVALFTSPQMIRPVIRNKQLLHPAAWPVVFKLYNGYPITHIQVVELTKPTEDDPDPPDPVWDVVADGAPAAVDKFNYGQSLKGLRPVVEGASPEKLKPNVPYRLIVEMGRQKAQVDFKTKPYVAGSKP